MTELGAGLLKVRADTPLNAGYAQATGGYSWANGPFVRTEAGWRPAPAVSIFGFGQWDRVEPMVGAGLRWDW